MELTLRSGGATTSHVTWSPASDVTSGTCRHVEHDVVVTSEAVTGSSHRCSAYSYEYVDLTQVGAVRVVFVALYVGVAGLGRVGGWSRRRRRNAGGRRQLDGRLDGRRSAAHAIDADQLLHTQPGRRRPARRRAGDAAQAGRVHGAVWTNSDHPARSACRLTTLPVSMAVWTSQNHPARPPTYSRPAW